MPIVIKNSKSLNNGGAGLKAEGADIVLDNFEAGGNQVGIDATDSNIVAHDVKVWGETDVEGHRPLSKGSRVRHFFIDRVPWHKD